MCKCVSGLVEFCKAFDTRYPFPLGFRSGVLKRFACFSFSILAHEKFSHLLRLKRTRTVLWQTCLFFSFFVKRCRAELSHCQVKQGSGHRKKDEGWVRPARWWNKLYVLYCHMHLILSMCHERLALELTLSFKWQNTASTSVNLLT